ncbi:hypothetical protein QN224_33625, partial [Sinorhizobium sp. 8-89]|uniref:hypothetical protein n=1 Tax=Sinorhizobium sp. 7-81 TaxID=3049087 RepID=UPI0024C40EB4
MTNVVRIGLENLDDESLAQLFLLAKEKAAKRNEAATLIPQVSRNEPLVLSFAQQRLWFLAQLDAAGTNYHVPLALR